MLRNIWKLAIVGGLFLLTYGCGSPSNEDSVLKEEVDANSSDFTFGRGYDTLRSATAGDCVIIAGSEPAFDTEGKEYTSTINKIESSKDLVKLLNVAAKAKFSAGSGSVKGKASLVDTIKINSQSLYLAIKVQVTNPIYTMQEVKLKDDAIALFKSSPDRFRDRCGDEFVRSYILGGEFIVIFEFQTVDQNHQEAIESAFKDYYGTFKESLSFSNVLEEQIRNNRTQLFVYQSGGKVEKLSLSADDLMNTALEYPNLITQQNAKPIMAITASYKFVDNLPAERSFIDVANSEKVLNELANYDLDLSDLLATVDYALLNQDQYRGLNVIELYNSTQEIKKSLNTVRKAASECVSNYKNCVLPQITIPSISLPKRVAACSDIKDSYRFSGKVNALNGWDYRKLIHSYTIPISGIYDISVSGTASQKPCGQIFVKPKTSSSIMAYDWTTSSKNRIDIFKGSNLFNAGDVIEFFGARAGCSNGYPSFNVDFQVQCKNF